MRHPSPILAISFALTAWASFPVGVVGKPGFETAVEFGFPLEISQPWKFKTANDLDEVVTGEVTAENFQEFSASFAQFK